MVLPSTSAQYRSRGILGCRSTSGYTVMLIPSGPSGSCENGSPDALADDGKSLKVPITARTLFDSDFLHSSPYLVRHYGGDHNANIAFYDETAANHKSSDRTLIPWTADIPLSQTIAAGYYPRIKQDMVKLR